MRINKDDDDDDFRHTLVPDTQGDSDVILCYIYAG